jgi:hypothetical protein
MDGLDALRALFEPATQTVQTATVPATRKKECEKCPFGDKLSPGERMQASALKARLADEPNKLWGCHETVNGEKPQICAGFAKWRASRLTLAAGPPR